MKKTRNRIAWNKGIPWSEKIRKKMSESHKREKLSIETIYRMSKARMGKKLTIETKRKMSESHKRENLSKETLQRMSMTKKGKIPSIETRKKMSKARIGKILSIETRKKISESHKRENLSKKTLQKMSEGMKRAYACGKRILPKRNFGKIYSVKNKKWINYRSYYELSAYKLLEQMAMVIKYEIEPFVIPYRNDYDDVRSYFPDLLIYYRDGSKELIEIKPSKLINHWKNRKKFKAAQNFCNDRKINFSIWSECDIFEHKLRKPLTIH